MVTFCPSLVTHISLVTIGTEQPARPLILGGIPPNPVCTLSTALFPWSTKFKPSAACRAAPTNSIWFEMMHGMWRTGQ